jgi:hypothetical protein
MTRIGVRLIHLQTTLIRQRIVAFHAINLVAQPMGFVNQPGIVGDLNKVFAGEILYRLSKVARFHWSESLSPRREIRDPS